MNPDPNQHTCCFQARSHLAEMVFETRKITGKVVWGLADWIETALWTIEEKITP